MKIPSAGYELVHFYSCVMQFELSTTVCLCVCV